MKVLCALNFYAHGCYQRKVGFDIHIRVSQSTVSKCIREVSTAISTNLLHEFVKFPEDAGSQMALKEEFYEYCGIGGILGAIDCTHVAIIAPPDDGFHNERNYINRKGWHSVNVQLVCDMNMLIINVVARFPGCTHDAYIWQSSLLKRSIYSGSLIHGEGWLIGDSGYPQEVHLHTPFSESLARREGQVALDYNAAHSRGRCVIERCNGVLKNRFRLNSGWSVHSQDYFQKSEQIPVRELRSIEYVLERARRIESCERERIGRMVCRLENMKRNAVGDGKKTCSMCAASFGFFRSSPVCCVDCSMAVCEKCRIDICDANQETCILCKICAENRELWKKSGGWFYGKVLSQTDLTRTKEKDEDEDLCNSSLNCSKTFNTWEHTRPDIVRLESFEPPEVKLNESPLYKNWAVSSSPDLKSLDENTTFFDGRLEKLRKRSDVVDKLQMYRLSHLEIPNSKLSVSCPSLQVEEIELAQKKHHFSRKRLLSPAFKVMEKISKHYKH